MKQVQTNGHEELAEYQSYRIVYSSQHKKVTAGNGECGHNFILVFWLQKSTITFIVRAEILSHALQAAPALDKVLQL